MAIMPTPRKGKTESGGSDFVKQIRVTFKHLEQLYQSQWRFGLAVLVARECVNATTEYFGSFALVERKKLAYAGDKARIYDGRIHLLRESAHLAHNAIRFCRVQDRLSAGWAEITSHRRNNGGFTLVGVRQIAGVVD